MKKLTIYIPSYNRGLSLLKQLEAINSSIDKSKVDVVVSNNNSPDIEYKNVEKYCIENGFLYIKNQINIGADANIFNGFMHSFNSEYIWILSDDDLLKDSSVGEILNILDNDLDILFITHSNIKKLIIETWGQKELYEKNIKISDGAGLISNVIYKTEFVKNSIPIGFKNIYTCFCHLSVLIHSLKNKKAMVSNIGSYNFFVPDTNLPPESAAGYSSSYFGFVLLGELFEDKIKKEFINDYANFFTLRHWYIKKRDDIAKQNCVYAESYIKQNLYILNFFRMKLCFWFLFTPLLEFIKKTLSRNTKDRILKLLRVGF